MRQMTTQGFSSAFVGSPAVIRLQFLIFEECAPPIPVYRLISRSGFGYAVGSVEAAASNDIQEKIFLDGCLMWYYAAVRTLFIVFI